MALFGLIPRYRREVAVYVGGRLRDAVLGMPVEEVYRTQPELQAVVSFLAASVAQLPIKCYVRESDSDRRRDTEGPLPQLLANPGGGFTTYELMLGTMSDLCLYGWAMWWVLPSADAPSGFEMRRIPPSWVQVTKSVDGFSPSSYSVANREMSGVPVRVPASQCVRFVTYNPASPVVPLSPVDALKQVLAERASSREYRNKVWRNGGWFSRYIERPAQDGEWSREARERFAKSMKDRFSGPDGVDSGGIPILEDGMRFVNSALNAKEAEWAESMRLTREDVAAAYHLNPAQVWSNDGQTYASVKENARSLYADTLGPNLRLIEDRIKATLVPMIGADPKAYAEFDLSAKLAGSFEEQAAVLSQAVGGPWMLRNEARARQNMPAVEGGDELIVPLNVVEGGLASPHDTDPTKGMEPVALLHDGTLFALPGAKSAGSVPKATRTTLSKSMGAPSEDAVTEITNMLSHFARRQSKRVLADMSKEDEDVESEDGGDPPWWDRERWDRELADDLTPAMQTWATYHALKALADLGVPASVYSAARTVAFVQSMAQTRARAFNAVTLRQLKSARAGEAGEDNLGSTPEGVFDKAAGSRAERAGVSFATSAAAFGTTEAARQAYPRDTNTVRRYKVWHHKSSANPRATHMAMDGERVGLDERFSNNALWPGDSAAGPDETCNCHCQVEVEIVKGDSVTTREPLTESEQETVSELASRLDLAEGYDPYSVHDAFSKCQRTIGQKEAEWSGLTTRQHDEVLAELRTRDQSWVATGEIRDVSYKGVSKAERRRMKKNHESDGHSFMRDQGFRTDALPTLDNALANIDMRLNDILWELKTVNGGGGGLNARFDEAVSKWERLHRAGLEMDSVPRVVVDNRFGTMNDNDAISKIKHNIKFFDDADDRESLVEVLLITRDGKLLRIKK